MMMDKNMCLLMMMMMMTMNPIDVDYEMIELLRPIQTNKGVNTLYMYIVRTL